MAFSFRVIEIDTSPIWHNAPEYQLLDNDYYENELGEDWMQTHYTAENYDLHSAPEDYTNPIGEWNTAKIICNNGHIEHCSIVIKPSNIKLTPMNGKT